MIFYKIKFLFVTVFLFGLAIGLPVDQAKKRFSIDDLIRLNTPNQPNAFNTYNQASVLDTKNLANDKNAPNKANAKNVPDLANEKNMINQFFKRFSIDDLIKLNTPNQPNAPNSPNKANAMNSPNQPNALNTPNKENKVNVNKRVKNEMTHILNNMVEELFQKPEMNKLLGMFGKSGTGEESTIKRSKRSLNEEVSAADEESNDNDHEASMKQNDKLTEAENEKNSQTKESKKEKSKTEETEKKEVQANDLNSIPGMNYMSFISPMGGKGLPGIGILGGVGGLGGVSGAGALGGTGGVGDYIKFIPTMGRKRRSVVSSPTMSQIPSSSYLLQGYPQMPMYPQPISQNQLMSMYLRTLGLNQFPTVGSAQTAGPNIDPATMALYLNSLQKTTPKTAQKRIVNEE